MDESECLKQSQGVNEIKVMMWKHKKRSGFCQPASSATGLRLTGLNRLLHGLLVCPWCQGNKSRIESTYSSACLDLLSSEQLHVRGRGRSGRLVDKFLLGIAETQARHQKKRSPLPWNPSFSPSPFSRRPQGRKSEKSSWVDRQGESYNNSNHDTCKP